MRRVDRLVGARPDPGIDLRARAGVGQLADKAAQAAEQAAAVEKTARALLRGGRGRGRRRPASRSRRQEMMQQQRARGDGDRRREIAAGNRVLQRIVKKAHAFLLGRLTGPDLYTPCVFHVHDVKPAAAAPAAPYSRGNTSWVGSPGSFSDLSAASSPPSLSITAGSGILVDIVIGIVGAIVGGYIGAKLGVGGINGLTLWSILLVGPWRGRRAADL